MALRRIARALRHATSRTESATNYSDQIPQDAHSRDNSSPDQVGEVWPDDCPTHADHWLHLVNDRGGWLHPMFHADRRMTPPSEWPETGPYQRGRVWAAALARAAVSAAGDPTDEREQETVITYAHNADVMLAPLPDWADRQDLLDFIAGAAHQIEITLPMLRNFQYWLAPA